jgi:excisionase family DNA binding protein
MTRLVTPKQVAQAIGVSEASLKRWCDKGLLPARRTAGGHRRLPIDGVVQWLRKSRRPIIRPEVLGLPSNTGSGDGPIERSVELLKSALVAGDEVRCRQIVINLYLAGHGIVELGDRLIAPTFDALGSAWQHGDIEVYQERRGCEICMEILHELKTMLPVPVDDAPYAIGGTLAEDPYTLANATVELALREAGWLAESHGCCNPGETLAAAIRERRPNMFWLSVSTFGSVEALVASHEIISKAAEACGVTVAVGGRALTPLIRQEMASSVYCERLRDLVALAGALTRSTSRSSGSTATR